MLKKHSALKAFLHTIKGLHLENIRRGLYGYMWWTALRIILIYMLIVIPLVLVARHMINLDVLFNYIFINHSDRLILIIFFLSECFLGMLPPDLFVIWSAKFSTPLIYLILLGLLSYIGGAISYLIGRWISNRPGIRSYYESVLDKYINLVRRWGGAFIIIAALFPFSPFPLVILSVSLLKYPFKLYLLFGISRIARFVLQGILYLDILNMDALLMTLK